MHWCMKTDKPRNTCLCNIPAAKRDTVTVGHLRRVNINSTTRHVYIYKELSTSDLITVLNTYKSKPGSSQVGPDGGDIVERHKKGR